MSRSQQYFYPFSAIAGQETLKEALLLNVVNPGIGGVLVRGEKGTAKSTAVRALAAILPEINVVKGCPCNCDPETADNLCPLCRDELAAKGELTKEKRRVRVTELPVGASEDRVVGSLDMEAALASGRRRFEHGLLASANRGILYVDEVNLLEDHIVDVLLDAAAMGVNTVEREGLSWSHPARFTLVGTMNPEEGELRPQLLDRFGLCVHVRGMAEPEQRMTVMKRRMDFERDPAEFCATWQEQDHKLADRIMQARRLLPMVRADDACMRRVVEHAIAAQVDGHRADIVMLKTATTLAALDGRADVACEDVDKAASLALPHRMRRNPFESVGGQSA